MRRSQNCRRRCRAPRFSISPVTATSLVRWATCRAPTRVRRAGVRRSAGRCRAVRHQPRGQQIRLAVLAGCQTGRREGVSVWSGIAPALTKVDIPAVVANQYSINDTSAIAFSRRFYQALAGGLPLEDAVSAGRLAVYNQDPRPRLGRAGAVPAGCERPAVRRCREPRAARAGAKRRPGRHRRAHRQGRAARSRLWRQASRDVGWQIVDLGHDR